jgi:hypothetical protein
VVDFYAVQANFILKICLLKPVEHRHSTDFVDVPTKTLIYLQIFLRFTPSALGFADF